MQEFVDRIIIPLILKRGWSSVCEIGAKYGASTDRLRSLPGVGITVIDPCLDCDLIEKYSSNPDIRLRKGLSLEVLPTLRDPFDCVLLDGDHNWYTVYHELKTIYEFSLLKPRGMAFFHDVAWPYGRRDMYYLPDTVPPEYRQPCAQKGIVPGQSELSDIAEFNSRFWNATHEGGSRNGVLTGIEDFLSEHRGEFSFFRLNGNYGLGVMQRRDGLTADVAFLGLRCRGLGQNALTWMKTATQLHFPGSYSAVKSLLK